MVLWIVKTLFRSVFRGIHAMGYRDAIKDILVFRDKIYFETVTIHGDHNLITNCTFLGKEYGLMIIPKDKGTDGVSYEQID